MSAPACRTFARHPTVSGRHHVTVIPDPNIFFRISGFYRKNTRNSFQCRLYIFLFEKNHFAICAKTMAPEDSQSLFAGKPDTGIIKQLQ
jgi:hypothetical protein